MRLATHEIQAFPVSFFSNRINELERVRTTIVQAEIGVAALVTTGCCPTLSTSPGAGEFRMRRFKFSEKSSRRCCDTSAKSPEARPYCATEPASCRSVTIETFVKAPSGMSCMTRSACAVPRPFLSEPRASTRVRWLASSISVKLAIPSNVSKIGPSLTETRPLNDRSSIFSTSSPPGTHSAIEATSSRRGHACWSGA